VLSQQAKLPEIRLHDLRHTHATATCGRRAGQGGIRTARLQYPGLCHDGLSARATGHAARSRAAPGESGDESGPAPQSGRCVRAVSKPLAKWRRWKEERKPWERKSPSLQKRYAPGRIRTCGPRIRSPLLYPAELQAHDPTPLLWRTAGARAGDGVRTRDIQLGRLTLCHLSYTRLLHPATPAGPWSGREDLNLRPPAPKAGALPGCATSRQPHSLGFGRESIAYRPPT
jgi:hypothetical protein